MIAAAGAASGSAPPIVGGGDRADRTLEASAIWPSRSIHPQWGQRSAGGIAPPQ
ncbi:MAG TPA: hypothetical protein VGV64_03440 [Thermoplasmata archaeon]|nr:hypothetical protein [Thermoplasmata archaeon]